MRYALLFCSVVALLSACQQDPNDVPEPSGELVTFRIREDLPFRFLEDPDVTYYLNIDDMGPAGISMRNIGILRVGNPIQLDVKGKVVELGVIRSIDLQNHTVNVWLYDSYVVVKNQ